MNAVTKPHPHLLVERAGALASVCSDLHHALGHIRAARLYNDTHGLGIAIPTEKQFLDAIKACADAHKAEAQA
jgi:hypothetical protein